MFGHVGKRLLKAELSFYLALYLLTSTSRVQSATCSDMFLLLFFNVNILFILFIYFKRRLFIYIYIYIFYFNITSLNRKRIRM